MKHTKNNKMTGLEQRYYHDITVIADQLELIAHQLERIADVLEEANTRRKDQLSKEDLRNLTDPSRQ